MKASTRGRFLLGLIFLAPICFANVLPLFRSDSTVPSNGDVNPYGLGFVPPSFGCTTSPRSVLKAGDILVANFNNASNVQGTGTTVVRIDPETGNLTTFFTSPLQGLSAAFGFLNSGYVLVGNVPNIGGTGVVGTGVLQVLNRRGQVVAIIDTAVDDPWGLTVFEDRHKVQIFVSNAFPGNGTVVRVDLCQPPDFSKASFTVIGSNFTARADPAAFVVGPAGLAYDPEHDVLFVAAEGDNAIYKIPQAGSRHTSAGRGILVFADNTHLHGPLGLTFTPDERHLITANADSVNVDPNNPSELVEFTVDGHFLAVFSIENATGAAFEVAFGVIRSERMRVFAAVDDIANAVQIWSQGAASNQDLECRSNGHHGYDDDDDDRHD